MQILDLIICVLVAVLNMANIALVIHLHNNGRRISGVINSLLKTVTFLFCAFAIQVGVIGVLPLPVTLCFITNALSAMRRTWVLFRQFKRSHFGQGLFNEGHLWQRHESEADKLSRAR